MKTLVLDFGNTLVRRDMDEWKKLEKAGLINLLDFFKKRNLRHITHQKWVVAFEKALSVYSAGNTASHRETDILKVFRYLTLVFRLPQDIAPEQIAQMYYLPLSQSRVLFDDVIPVLKILQSRRIRIGLLSNTTIPGVIMNETLQRLQLSDFFAFTLYSSDIGFRKPHKAVFELAIALSESKPQDILMVGDEMGTDIQGAERAGMKAILLNRNIRIQSLPKSRKVARSLYEILTVMEK